MKRRDKTLSDLAVRKAQATGKAYTLPDSDGLTLAVSADGGKSWHFRYYWSGTQKRMSLGTYAEVGLKDARMLRDEVRSLLAKGINPRADRKQKRQSVKLADENTFGAVYDKWIRHRELVLKEGRQTTLTQIRRVFRKDVLPILGKRSIYEIRRGDLPTSSGGSSGASLIRWRRRCGHGSTRCSGTHW